MKKNSRRAVVGLSAFALAITMALAAPLAANAYNYWLYFEGDVGSNEPQSVTSALNYNGHQGTAMPTGGQTVLVYTVGVGTSSSISSVLQTFSSRTVSGNCKIQIPFNVGGSHLWCELRY